MALLRKITCNLRHAMHLRHPVCVSNVHSTNRWICMHVYVWVCMCVYVCYMYIHMYITVMPIYMYTYTHSGYAAMYSAYSLYIHSRYIYIHVFITVMPIYIYYIPSRYICIRTYIPVMLIYIHTFTHSGYAAVYSSYVTRYMAAMGWLWLVGSIKL